MPAPTPSATPTPPPAALRWRRLSKRAGIALLGLLLILIVVFFLIPVWISNEQGRTYVLERINRRIAPDGLQLAIGEWSLGWFRGTDLKNVRLTLPDNSTLAASPHITSGLSLWDIFWGSYDLRSTTIDDLHLDVIRYADGHTSLDGLVGGYADVLDTIRGAVQVQSGHLTITSIRTSQSVTYDLKATLTVAAPDAPFHVQVAGVSAGNEGVGDGGPRDISLSAAFPPLNALRRGPLASPPLWESLADVEFAATNIPTGLACDFLHLDPRWAASIGDYLETLRFSNHLDPAQQTSRPALMVRGGGRAGRDASAAGAAPADLSGDRYLDVRLLLRYVRHDLAILSLPQATATRPAGMSPANPLGGAALTGAGGPVAGAGGDDFHAEVSCHISPPLAELLSRIDPVFAELRAGAGTTHIHLLTLDMPLGKPLGDASGTARITFPDLTFAPQPQGLVGQLLTLAGDPPPAGGTITAQAGPLHVRLEDQHLAFENAVLVLGSTGVNLSGTVGLDGSLDLIATLPHLAPGGGGTDDLGSETARVAVRGRVAAPIIQRAR